MELWTKIATIINAAIAAAREKRTGDGSFTLFSDSSITSTLISADATLIKKLPGYQQMGLPVLPTLHRNNSITHRQH